MTKEEIWEKLETEFKLRGYSKKSISTYKAGITTFLDWANKPYEDLDEEDFRNSYPSGIRMTIFFPAVWS